MTLSGMASSSMMLRTKSKSVSDADGNPTSISENPSCDERIEHHPLALGVHRFDERLVAVAKVDRAPEGCLGDGFRSATFGRCRSIGNGAYFWIGMTPGALLVETTFFIAGLFMLASCAFCRPDRSLSEVLTAAGSRL